MKKAEQRLARPKNESLSNYAQRVEQTFPQFQGLFSQLTKRYEDTLYGEKKSITSGDTEVLMQVAKQFNSLKN